MPGVARPLAYALAACAVAACGSKRSPPPAPSADAAIATVGPVVRDLGAVPPHLAEPQPPMPQEVRATLLEPGAPPRTPRRYLTAAAPERTLTVRAAITVRGYRDGAWYGPTDLPEITDGFAISVEPAGATTTVVLRGVPGTVADATGAARVAADELTARWRTLLERRRVTVAVDARGRLGAVSFLDDPDRKRPDAELATDELVQRWLALAVPWPDEPIGLGARWRVVTLLRVGGAYVKQTATYHLTAIAADRLTVEVEVTRLAERQLLDLPGLPAGARAEAELGVGALGRGQRAGEGQRRGQADHDRALDRAHDADQLGPGAPVDEVTDDRATLTLTSP